MTTLILCRHGESGWNVDGRVQGQSFQAPGLTERGKQQAAQLARRLSALGLDKLYASDLPRALETAQIVSAAVGLSPILDSRWREASGGRWETLSHGQIKARWPQEWDAMQQGEDIARGGGESYADLQARVIPALNDLKNRHSGETVAVICHGGPIYACLGWVLDRPPTQLADMLPPNLNTSVTVLRATGSDIVADTIMDVEHLDLELEAEVETQPQA